MITNGWSVLLGIAAPVIGVLGVYLAQRMARSAQRESSAMTMLREDNAELRRRIDASERRERILEDYARRLRRAIDDGRPPPPEEWPEGL